MLVRFSNAILCWRKKNLQAFFKYQKLAFPLKKKKPTKYFDGKTHPNAAVIEAWVVQINKDPVGKTSRKNR